MRLSLSIPNGSSDLYQLAGNHHIPVGVIISSNLMWSSRYDIICAKAYILLNFIRRVLKQSGTTEQVQLNKKVTVLVRSHCSQLWRSYTWLGILPTNVYTARGRSTSWMTTMVLKASTSTNFLLVGAYGLFLLKCLQYHNVNPTTVKSAAFLTSFSRKLAQLVASYIHQDNRWRNVYQSNSTCLERHTSESNQHFRAVSEQKVQIPRVYLWKQQKIELSWKIWPGIGRG